jgi:hypothetical protein
MCIYIKLSCRDRSNVKRHNTYDQKIDAYNVIRDGQEENLNMVRKCLANRGDAFFDGEMS